MKIRMLFLVASCSFFNIAAAKSIVKTPKAVVGTISAFEMGDNFYLTLIDKKGMQHTGLCSVPFCEKLITAKGDNLGGYKGKKVRVVVGQGNQVDGAGNVMGTMDAFVKIQLLK